jgi:hypothetical protein
MARKSKDSRFRKWLEDNDNLSAKSAANYGGVPRKLESQAEAAGIEIPGNREHLEDCTIPELEQFREALFGSSPAAQERMAYDRSKHKSMYSCGLSRLIDSKRRGMR